MCHYDDLLRSPRRRRLAGGPGDAPADEAGDGFHPARSAAVVFPEGGDAGFGEGESLHDEVGERREDAFGQRRRPEEAEAVDDPITVTSRLL